MKTLMAAILLVFLSGSFAVADTTVVEVKHNGTLPYDNEIRIYVHKQVLYFYCRNQDLRSATAKNVNDWELLNILHRLVGWGDLNEQVKTKVTKTLKTGNITARFEGLESGRSLYSFSASANNWPICIANIYLVKDLIRGLELNLADAKAEDAKNKADLFK